jgi:hypothetical protein
MCSHSAHAAPFVLRVTTSGRIILVIVCIIVVVEIMIALVVFLVKVLSGNLAKERLSRVGVRMRGVVEGSALGLETGLQFAQGLIATLVAVAVVCGHARGTRVRFKYVWCTVDAVYDVAMLG